MQGDVIAILDEDGNVVVSYVYDAWGQPIGKAGTLASTLGTLNPFRYRGYVYDEESGLYYLRSRFYHSEWMRFANADALLNPNFNLFCYCMQQPINRGDPNGTDFFEYCWDEMSNRSFMSPFNLGSIAGGYQGNTSDIWSGYGTYKSAMAYENLWINSSYNLPGNTTTPKRLKEIATTTAKQYVSDNPGKGAVYGTKGHSFVEAEINKYCWSNVKTEVSYKKGIPVPYASSGSVRLDILLYDDNGFPAYAIDLKFGKASLTPQRIEQINRQLPKKIHIDQVP